MVKMEMEMVKFVRFDGRFIRWLWVVGATYRFLMKQNRSIHNTPPVFPEIGSKA